MNALPRRLARLAATITDQAVYGASSVVLVWSIARWAGAHYAGQIAMATVPFVLATVVAQGLFVDSVVIRGCLNNSSERVSTVQNAAAFAVPVGAVGAAIAWCVDLPPIAVGAVAAASITGVVQATLRAFLLAQRRPGRALVSDLVWVIPQITGVYVLASSQPRASDAATIATASWALGSVLAFFVLVEIGHLVPRSPRLVLVSIVRDRALGYEGFMAQAAAQGAIVILAALAGTAAAGSLRTAQTFTTPVLLIIAAGRHWVLPWVTSHARQAAVLTRALVAANAAALAGGVAIAAAAFCLLEGVVGRLILGASQVSTAPLVPILLVSASLGGASIVSSLVLRSAGRVAIAVRVRLVHAAASVGAVAVGAYLGGDAASAALALLAVDLLLSGVWLLVSLRLILRRDPMTRASSSQAAQ